MKVVLSLMLGLTATSTCESSKPLRVVPMGDIKPHSEFGKRILSKAIPARRAENVNQYISYYENGQQAGYYQGNKNYGGGNGNGGNNNANVYAQLEHQMWTNYMIVGSSWLDQYSIKFQGCYDTLKWNDEAVDVEDVRLINRHVVRFRLCPASQCVPGYKDGCSSDYGDYLIDLESYLKAYVEAKQVYDNWYEQVYADQQWAQQEQKQYVYNRDFDVEQYMECKQSNIDMDIDDYAQVYYQQMKNYNNNQNNNNQQQQKGGKYYTGPYCGGQGGAILIGMFKDDKCTIPADESGGKLAYMSKTGNYLPFSDRSIIEYDCFSCEEPQAEYNNAGNDADDEDTINNFCEEAYLKSGKCEQNLPRSYFNMYKRKNNNACNYIDGIKMIREDGTIMTTSLNSPGHFSSKTAGSFLLTFFSSTFLGLSFYVAHLKSKFQRSNVALE